MFGTDKSVPFQRNGFFNHQSNGFSMNLTPAELLDRLTSDEYIRRH
jgi:hypothetical protein